MNDNDLNDHQFDALMMDEARVRWVRERAQLVSTSCLPEQLRLSGEYPRLVNARCREGPPTRIGRIEKSLSGKCEPD